MSKMPRPCDLVVVEERPRRYLRVQDAARDLGSSDQHVRDLADRGKIERVYLDGLALIPVESWNRYLDGAVPMKPGDTVASMRKKAKAGESADGGA